MPDVTPFELRRFGAALVLSLAALVSCAVVSHAADAEAPAASAAAGDAAAPEAGASKNGEAAAKHEGASHRKEAAATDAREGESKPGHAKPADEKPAGARVGEAKPSEPSLLTLRQAREEAEKEGRRNGARSKAADGTLLVWDNVNSVWVAPQPKNTYWVVDRFYQFNEGIWLVAKTVAGPWEMTSQQFVPEAPRGRHIAPKESVTARLPSGVEAIYEPRLKVFKVAGRKGVFLNDGVYYRYDSGVWFEGKTEEGPWTTTSASVLPGPLRRALTPAEKGSKVTLPTGDVLVSEGEPNLFAVEGKPDLLYFDGKYYERRDSKWFVSMKSSEGWEEISSQKIPGMVRSNYHKTGDEKAKRKPGEKKNADKKPPRQKKDGAGAGKKKAPKATTSGD